MNQTDTNESYLKGDLIRNINTGTQYVVTGIRRGMIWLRRFGTDGNTGPYIAFNPSKHTRGV
jgi:hypothetical protein